MIDINTQAEHLQIYIWILSGTLGFLLTLIMIVGNKISQNIGQKISEMTQSLNTLISVSTAQTEQIKNLYSQHASETRRLDDHAKRIREIEIRCSSRSKCFYQEVEKETKTRKPRPKNIG